MKYYTSLHPSQIFQDIPSCWLFNTWTALKSIKPSNFYAYCLINRFSKITTKRIHFIFGICSQFYYHYITFFSLFQVLLYIFLWKCKKYSKNKDALENDNKWNTFNRRYDENIANKYCLQIPYYILHTLLIFVQKNDKRILIFYFTAGRSERI